MKIGGWVLLVAGLLIGVYGKYFHDSPYRVYGIVVAMGGDVAAQAVATGTACAYH